MNPFASFAFNATDPDESQESGEDDACDEEEKKEQACDKGSVDTASENDGKVRFISGKAGRCVNGILIDYMFIPPPPRQTNTADTSACNSSAHSANLPPSKPSNSASGVDALASNPLDLPHAYNPRCATRRN